MLLDRRSRALWPFAAGSPAPQLGRAARAGLVALTVVVAVGTSVRLFQIGDSGAKATWQRVHFVPDTADDRGR